MNTTNPKTRRLRRGTAAAFAQAIVDEGIESAMRQLRDPIFHRRLDKVSFLKKQNAKQQGIRFLHPSAQPSYEAYDYALPRTWQPEYSIARIKIPNIVPTHFSSHASETYIVPITEGVQVIFADYVIEGDQLARIVVDVASGKDLHLSEIAMIRSTVPHKIITSGEQPAEAWLITRHCGGSPVAVIGCGGLPNDYLRTLEELQEYTERYYMLSTGLAEEIAMTRKKSRLSMVDLASQLATDRAWVSKLEHGQSNSGLQKLDNVCQVLGVPWQDIILTPPWLIRRQPLQGISIWQSGSTYFSFDHYLVEAEDSIALNGCRQSPFEELKTVIVLEGKVIIDAKSNPPTSSELLVAGDACHFKGADTSIAIQALEASKLLVVKGLLSGI